MMPELPDKKISVSTGMISFTPRFYQGEDVTPVFIQEVRTGVHFGQNLILLILEQALMRLLKF